MRTVKLSLDTPEDLATIRSFIARVGPDADLDAILAAAGGGPSRMVVGLSLPAEFAAGGRLIGRRPTDLRDRRGGLEPQPRPRMSPRRLIDVAADAGADAVKFQTYSGDRIYSRRARSEYLERFAGKTPAELLEEISLPREWQAELADHARARGIDFFSSPFDHEAVDELAELGVPLLKIASGEIVDLPLIRRAAATGIPLIISTGMATLAEIDDAVTAAEEAGAPAVGLMQCASVYPAPVERINLRAMETLRAAFGVPAGLSDHTTGSPCRSRRPRSARR